MSHYTYTQIDRYIYTYIHTYIHTYILTYFLGRVSLLSSGYPGTPSIDQAGLKLRDLPPPVSLVLGLKGVSCYHSAFFYFFDIIILPLFSPNPLILPLHIFF
jgi:hypothetical protein